MKPVRISRESCSISCCGCLLMPSADYSAGVDLVFLALNGGRPCASIGMTIHPGNETRHSPNKVSSRPERSGVEGPAVAFLGSRANTLNSKEKTYFTREGSFFNTV